MELKPSTPTTDKNQTEKVFTIFPKLPRELRDEIWNKSIIPRLAHFQPGGGMAPAVLFVNEESRKATCGHYLVCYVPLQRHGQRHGQYALFINFKMDNVCRKQEGLTASVVIKADLFWNVQPWIRCLKVLNKNLDIAAKSKKYTPQAARQWWNSRALSVTRPVAEGQTIWVKIKAMCPDLKELNVVLNGRLEKDNTLEEVVENNTGDLQDTEQQRHMKVVRDGLESHRTVGNFVNLKLTFLNLVPFTPMWDMDMKSSFVAWAG